MASHQATKAISLSALQRNNKMVYVSLLFILSFFLLLDYVPGMQAYSAWVTPPVALFLGLAFALSCGQAHPKFNKKVSKYLLQYSVVGLGFGMNLHASLASGKEGMEFTIISVIGTLLIGWVIGRKFLKVDRDTSYLISTGTAICGGSAIAAVGPVLKAKDTEMSVALGTIFILNAIALFIFPVIGHALDMSQQEFGTWAAIAIHDTSSVVGAGAAYGEEALKIATDLDMTGAQARWDEFAANPGVITTDAIIASYQENEETQKIQPTVEAFVSGYDRREPRCGHPVCAGSYAQRHQCDGYYEQYLPQADGCRKGGSVGGGCTWRANGCGRTEDHSGCHCFYGHRLPAVSGRSGFYIFVGQRRRNDRGHSDCFHRFMDRRFCDV